MLLTDAIQPSLLKHSKSLSNYIHKRKLMLEFITSLKQRYQVIQTGLVEESTQWTSFQASIEQLNLIESFLHKGRLIEQRQAALNIAVIGPTQSGKSTIVNLLLNQQVAGVSPLAGFTVHPQGFANGLDSHVIAGITEHFAGFQQVEQFSLSADKYNSYSISQIHSDKLPECILWDTPDFDSIDAQSYQTGVLKTLALADVLVLVVSKEKYADQSVWDALSLIEPLKQPILVVLNKLLADSQAVVIESFQQHWQQVRSDSLPTIMPILFNKSGISDTEQLELTRLLDSTFKKVKRKNQDAAAVNFIRTYWQSWLAPIRFEQDAQVQWQTLVEQVLKEAAIDYQRDYLNHPQHYQTFQNALAELLSLLEVPGIASVIAQSRKILAWPLRKVFGIGKKADLAHAGTVETAVLQQIAEHVFLQLGDNVLDRIDLTQEDNKWWKSINSQLRQDKGIILNNFERDTLIYHENFKQEIEKTAESLYHKLEEHPALLNSLRAMRVTADAAVLALTVQAGGIGLHDLILAPAMLSVTSYLAESAIGSYLNRAEAELKQRQLNTVKQQLFTQVLQQTLSELPAQMMQNTYFNISTEQLAEAEAQLEQKRHGLRIL